MPQPRKKARWDREELFIQAMAESTLRQAGCHQGNAEVSALPGVAGLPTAAVR